MKFNRAVWTVFAGLLALLLAFGARDVAAQPSQPSPQAKRPATTARKAPARKARARVRRPRRQTAPTRARIVEIQEALSREGCYSGKPSGRWDAKTSRAMREFQTSKGLTSTGKLGAQSLQKLGLGSEIAGLAAPLPQVNARPSALSESELDEPEEPSAN